MPTPAYELEINPLDPNFAPFVNGEKAISPIAEFTQTADMQSFWFGRKIDLPPGKYTITIVADDAVTVNIGNLFLVSRTIIGTVLNNGPVTAEFFVFPGENRFDILLHNDTSDNGLVADDYPDSFCWVCFHIKRDGQIVYKSSAEDWLFDSIPIPEDELLGGQSETTLLPVFTLLPNWRDGITERLEWLTDIVGPTEIGNEQRRSVRVFPRRSFEAGFSRKGERRARLDNFFTGIGRKPFWVPLWHEQHRVGVAFGLSTTGVSLPADTVLDREFRPGSVVIINNGDPAVYEVAQIETLDLVTGEITFAAALTQIWPAGSRIMPLRKARIVDAPTMNDLTDRVGQVQVRFELEDVDDTFASQDDYPGHPALTAPSWNYCAPLFQFKPNFSTALAFSYHRNDFEQDYQAGRTSILDPSDQARIGQRLSLLLRGREEVFTFRRFIAMARGRAQRFYMPSHTHDLVPAGDVQGAYVECRAAGYVALMRTMQQCRTLVGIVFKDGSPTLYRTITSAVEIVVGSTVTAERFNVDVDLPEIFEWQIERIQWIVSSRFDQDAFELHHHVDDSAAVTATVVTRSVDGTGMEPIDCWVTSEPYPVVAVESMASLAVIASGSLNEMPVPMEEMESSAAISDGTLDDVLVPMAAPGEEMESSATVGDGTLDDVLETYGDGDPEEMESSATVGSGDLDEVLITYGRYEPESIDGSCVIASGTLA